MKKRNPIVIVTGLLPGACGYMGAPPIYYDALVQMMREEAESSPQIETYTLDDLRQAVVEGKHPDGES